MGRVMFYVGQKVVCVDDAAVPGFSSLDPDEAIILGGIYTITSIHADILGVRVLWLAEVARNDDSKKHWGPLVGYGVYRFRPLIERKTDTGIAILRSILDDVNQREPV